VDRHQAAAQLERVAQLLQGRVGCLLDQFIQLPQPPVVQRRMPMPTRRGGCLARLTKPSQPALKGGDVDAIAACHLSLGLPGRVGGKGAFPNWL